MPDLFDLREQLASEVERAKEIEIGRYCRLFPWPHFICTVDALLYQIKIPQGQKERHVKAQRKNELIKCMLL